MSPATIISDLSNAPCLTRAWSAHHAELQQWLLRRVDDGPLAQDLLQDVFLKALRQGGRFGNIGNARAWLFEVARNTLTDHMRRQHITEALPDDLDDWPCTEAEPLAVVDQLTGCLARVLTELPEADADIIQRCDLEGMLQSDYAVQRGLRLPAVKARLRRARLRLKERMTEACTIQARPEGGVEAFTPRCKC